MYRVQTLILALCFMAEAAGQHRIAVVAPTSSSGTQRLIAERLVSEAGARSREKWSLGSSISSGSDTVFLAVGDRVADSLPECLRTAWRHAAGSLGDRRKAEGYTVASMQGGHVLVIAGADEAGMLFGAGWLLRNLPATGLPHPTAFFSAPEKPVRGYQIGYRMKNNTYDAWTLPQFEQQMWDLAVFGMNTVQVIAPNSDDDRTSPLFHAPPEEIVIALSKLSQKYGLRYDLYYPEMAKSYADPAQVAAELKQFEALVQRLPRVDSLHVPGGDPGHTAPEELFPLLAAQARILRRYHPQAEVWVSGQGFTAERFASFYAQLHEQPAWLTGVFFGPQSRDGMPVERARIPARFRLEFYPDIGHTMHAQFPVPQWDPIFALTEGREPICPRPQQFTKIYRHFADLNSGFMLYSEGVNDDVNKVLWASLGWDQSVTQQKTLQEYARYFFNIGADANAYANAILGLETNWNTPVLAANTTIPATHRLFHSLRGPKQANWRWHSLQYRDAYDRYVQLKRYRELQAQRQALRELQANGPTAERAKRAAATLNNTAAGAEEQALHSKMETLAATLFTEVGLQLSVPKYGASNWERGANLDRIDTPLNDKTWIVSELAKAMQVPSEEIRNTQLVRIANWQSAPANGSYDDLGDPANEPHLVRGTPWRDDPEMYHAAIDGIADQTLEHGWRLSWLSYAETLYETPLTLLYTHLDPTIGYRLKMTYAGEDYVLPMEVEANGVVVQPTWKRRTNPEEFEVELPHSITQGGTLTVQWKRKPGAGGGGRGGQVAEVWLLPDTIH